MPRAGDIASGPQGTEEQPMHRQPILPDGLRTDAGEQLAADLQALIACGLIEMRRDRDGEWRVALSETAHRG